MRILRRLGKDEIGTTAVEYAVMLAIILGVAVATLTALSANITRIFGLVNTLLTAVT
jgi:Flp pilus assembly pilin Flp